MAIKLLFVPRVANQPPNLQIKTCLILTAFAAMISSASASPIELAKASFRLSAKETLFTQPHTHSRLRAAQSDAPSQRRFERNMPWLEIQNDSADDIYLTEFHLTIGDERFHFSQDNFENFSVISPTSSFRDGVSQAVDDQNELVVIFNNGGLAPGQKMRFRIEIGVDADQEAILQQWAHPDFRTVLFDMNGIDAYGASPFTPRLANSEDNSSGYGVFRKGETIVRSEASSLPDFDVFGRPAFVFNQYRRNWIGPEAVTMFSSSVAASIVPEPQSFLLGTFAIVAVSLVLGRRSTATGERHTYGNHTANYRRRHAPRPQLHTTCHHRKKQNAPK